jgi:hypothetical protein
MYNLFSTQLPSLDIIDMITETLKQQKDNISLENYEKMEKKLAELTDLWNKTAPMDRPGPKKINDSILSAWHSASPWRDYS